jgi:hypothetical protein
MNSSFGFGPDFMFSVFPAIFTVMFVLIFGVIAAMIVRSVARGVKNSASPVLTVAARVVSKRSRTSGGAGDTAAFTRYYATFEVASGDRMELPVSGEQSGMLAEGDVGSLTFQGTRFHSFERQRE